MSRYVTTPTAMHDDGKYIRTSIVLTGESSEGSIAIVNPKGERIALLNIFTSSDNDWFAIDVIDVDERFNNRRALVFNKGKRKDMHSQTTLVAVDFRKDNKEE